MALSLNGSTGVSGVDGSAGTPAVQGADSNTGISFGTDEVSINTGGTTRAKVDSSGRLGVGTTSPQELLHVYNSSTTSRLIVGPNGTGAATPNALALEQSSTGYTVCHVRNLYDNSGLGELRLGGYGFTTVTSGSSQTERLRINSAGYIKASNTGSYLSASGSYHEVLSNDASNSTVFVTADNGSFASEMLNLRCTRAQNSAYIFLRTTSNSGSDVEHNLRGDGQAYADGSWNGGGADYAEYFEWSDANPDAEDRRGISVVLDGDKIREAVAGEEPIGVISGNPSVVGDAAWNKWDGKYLRDDFGTYVRDENGERQLNPAYDPDVEYINREDRPEWDCVGLMGKLRIRKGQITGSRWIKMRDISDSVEEWLVR